MGWNPFKKIESKTLKNEVEDNNSQKEWFIEEQKRKAEEERQFAIQREEEIREKEREDTFFKNGIYKERASLIEKTEKAFEEFSKNKPEDMLKIARMIYYNGVKNSVTDVEDEDVKHNGELAKKAMIALNEIKKMQEEGVDIEKLEDYTNRAKTCTGFEDDIDKCLTKPFPLASKEELEKAIINVQDYIDRADITYRLTSFNHCRYMATAYHMAKSDGKDSGLVKAVEELLGKEEKFGTNG